MCNIMLLVALIYVAFYSDSLSKFDIEYINKQCLSNGGVYNVDVPVVGTISVTCINGAVFKLNGKSNA